MQLTIDIISAEKAIRQQVFIDFVEQKKAEGYEALQYNIRVCAATLKKDLHWIMTIIHRTDPDIINVAEYESTELQWVTERSQSRMPDTTYRRRGWDLKKQYQITYKNISPTMQITLSDILAAELTRRLLAYKQLINAGEIERDTSNHRYLCIQTALWIVDGGTPPAIRKTEEETRAEVLRWSKEIQKNSTVKTMHSDGRVVALLQEFLEKTKPITAVPAQTRLI